MDKLHATDLSDAEWVIFGDMACWGLGRWVHDRLGREPVIVKRRPAKPDG